jgi:ATP-dependent Lhr-like helicase
VAVENERWFAAEASREPKTVLRGRLEALGPVFEAATAGRPEVPSDLAPYLTTLEGEGTILRARIEGRPAWCDRRLLARIHRYTLDRLRKEIEPVTATQFLRFLACWQHADGSIGWRGRAGGRRRHAARRLRGPRRGLGRQRPSARVRGYRREWLDQLTLSGEVMWGRLWGAGATPVRRTPICLFPREEAGTWSALAAAASPSPEPTGTAGELHDVLARRGPTFLQELGREAHLPAAAVEDGLAALIAQGRVTCDSFGGLRWLIVPAGRRRAAAGMTAGRWSLLPRAGAEAPSAGRGSPDAAPHRCRLPEDAGPREARRDVARSPGPAGCSRRGARSAAGASWPGSTASSTRCPTP